MPGVKRNESEYDGGRREDLGTLDEVKVFKEEGDEEIEENATESLHADLLEEKSSLINDSEQFSIRGSLATGIPNPYGVGSLNNPYAVYGNTRAPFAPFTANHLFSPPPAHMGSLPYERPPSFPSYPYQHIIPSHLGLE